MEPFGSCEGYLANSISFYRSNDFLKPASPPSLEAFCHPKLSYPQKPTTEKMGSKSLVTPPALKAGDTIAFISPSERMNLTHPAPVARAAALFESRGYQVRTFFTLDNGVQSSIANRHAEIRAAFLDPSVTAVVCTIGGTTFTELVPVLLADQDLCTHIKQHPKIFVGPSDITGFHWFLYAATGLRTFYGPSAIPELGTADSIDDETSPLAFCARHLLDTITKPAPLGDLARAPVYAPASPAFFFGDADSAEVQDVTEAPKWQWLRGGRAQGRLFGGCLTVAVRVNGIPALRPDWRGRIVFLEMAHSDTNPLERVQAAFADLIAHGVFEEAAGLVVGRPHGYDSREKRDAYAGVIRALLCEGSVGQAAGSQLPILFGVDIGHTTPMVTLPYDALALLDSEKDQFSVLEPGVA